MHIEDVPFTVTDWRALEAHRIAGESGWTAARSFERGNIRVRIVEFSAGYTADHWCERGHVAIVQDGELVIELRDGRSFELKKGMGFQVQDEADAHRAISRTGATIFIVD